MIAMSAQSHEGTDTVANSFHGVKRKYLRQYARKRFRRSMDHRPKRLYDTQSEVLR